MTLSTKFDVIENKIHFGYLDFAGTIEANTNWISENEFELEYVVSITKNGVDFKDTWLPTLEEAFKFVEEYDKQLKAERSQNNELGR